MRWRVVAAVVFVLACSYGILWSLGYARARLGDAVEGIAEELEVARQPRFEVRRGTLTLPAGEEKRLRIENNAGRVKVVTGGPETVAEYVIYARGENEADARRRAEALEVECGSDPDANRIWTRPAEGKRWPSHVSVDFVVKAPPETGLSVKTVSADVSVKSMDGALAIKTVSGDVSVWESAASVVAHTVSGDVRVDGAKGPVKAETTSGAVALTAFRGDKIIAHTVSGDIRIEAALPFAGLLESNTVSGDIGVALPATSDCEVQANTVSGDISGAPWGEVTGRQARARLNAATGSVRLKTTSGNIRLDASG